MGAAPSHPLKYGWSLRESDFRQDTCATLETAHHGRLLVEERALEPDRFQDRDLEGGCIRARFQLPAKGNMIEVRLNATVLLIDSDGSMVLREEDDDDAETGRSS